MNDDDEHDGDLVLLTQCGDNSEASALRGLLQANGIRCVIQGEQHRSMLGTLGAYIELNLMVPSSELDRARRLMAAPPDDDPLPELQVGPEDAIGDGPRKRRRVLGWVAIGLIAGPGLLAFLLRGCGR